MNSKPILIHTHFHYQRTGVTRSIENVFPYFDTIFKAYVYGHNVVAKKVSFLNLVKLIYSKRQVVVHCHRNNEILRMLLFRLLGAKFKLVSTRHAETRPSELTTFLHKSTDELVTLTQSMTRAFNFPTTVIGHGVDIRVFKPDKQGTLDQIKQKNVITCAGRIRKAKGQQVLIEAIAPVLKEHPDWALVLVGKVDDSELVKDAQTKLKANQIKNQVYFIGETSEIVRFYQASHTVVVPSFSEGFSLVCAEAMACGCNVVATDKVGIHSALIETQKNGYLFQPGDVQELQELLEKIISGKSPHLGSQAKESIEKNWSAETEAKKLIDLYLK